MNLFGPGQYRLNRVPDGRGPGFTLIELLVVIAIIGIQAASKVAQIFNLPYRRVALGRAALAKWRWNRFERPQITNLRYSRVQLCATAVAARGFTLIELLVVIAIVGVLAAMLLPVLGKAKLKAQTVGCVNNLKQLQLCWQMYTEDNNDGLPGNAALNNGDLGNRDGWTAEPSSWLQGNAWTDANPTNLQRGVLFRYNRSLGIYHCPADRSTVRDQGLLPRNRSVSMSMYMNFRPNPAEPQYDLCWHRLAQVQRPGPSRAAVFIDENEKSIQQSAFGINAPDSLTMFGGPLWTWVSLPATRHQNAGVLSFADGHAENWRWLEANTMQIAALNDWTVMKPAVANTDRDLGRFFKSVPEKVPVE